MTSTHRLADEPVRVFGLEPEDLIASFLIFAIGTLFLPEARIVGIGTARLLSVAGAIAFGWILWANKRGKPRGYLRYLLRRTGVERLLPRSARIRGAPDAPLPFASKIDRLRLRSPARYGHEA